MRRRCIQKIPPCVVLLLSNGYLRNDPVNNWDCAWELADAIRQLGDGRRSAAQTLAVYRDADSKALNAVVVPLLKEMGRHFGEAYAKVAWDDRPNFDYYDTFSKHFLEAVQGDKCRKFFEARGTLGSYLMLPVGVNAPGACDTIIAEVRKALNPAPSK